MSPEPVLCFEYFHKYDECIILFFLCDHKSGEGHYVAIIYDILHLDHTIDCHAPRIFCPRATQPLYLETGEKFIGTPDQVSDFHQSASLRSRSILKFLDLTFFLLIFPEIKYQRAISAVEKL